MYLPVTLQARAYTNWTNEAVQEKFRPSRNFLICGALNQSNNDHSIDHAIGIGMEKDKLLNQQRMQTQAVRADDGLGPNTDIGNRLRALYGAVQDEGVPDQLLDLLEKLDSAEQQQASKSGTTSRDGE